MQIFWKVESPSVDAGLMAGLRIGATLAVIGVTVGELVGGNTGLGYLITFGEGQANTAMVFNAIVLLTCRHRSLRRRRHHGGACPALHPARVALIWFGHQMTAIVQRSAEGLSYLVCESAGPMPVVLLHGIGSNARSFEPLMASLDGSYPTLAWDAPGTANCSRLQSNGQTHPITPPL